MAGTLISVFFGANDWRLNAVRGENFHHNAAQDTYPPEGVCKIRERRARGPTSKGIYSVRPDTMPEGSKRDRERERNEAGLSIVVLAGSSLEC